MGLPDVDVRVDDNALGLVAADGSSTIAKIGVATGGTPNTLYAFTDKETLVATLLGGPVVEAAADTLDDAGGTVLVGTVAASIPGTTSAVTHVGPGTGVVGVTGAPRDAYSVVVKIVQPGLLGVASFMVSLDGGVDFSPETSTTAGGTYPITDTGLTLTFSAAGYVKDDLYSFTCVAPGYSPADAVAALNVLLADTRSWKLVHIVGTPGGSDDAAKASACAGLSAAVGTLMAGAAVQHLYARALLEAPDVADAALTAAFASFVDTRIIVGAGFIDHLSSLTARITKRSATWPVATRLAKIPISQDVSWVGAGPLPSSVRKIYRDERKTPALDAQRFVTLRTIRGRRGFYITNANSMALPTSDYSLIQNGLVVDAACVSSYDAMVDYLKATLTVDAKTGAISEIDAVAAETKVLGIVGAAVLQPGHVTSLQIRINRTDNLLSTRKLRWKVRMVPHAYPREIEVEIGFINPALAVLPAA